MAVTYPNAKNRELYSAQEATHGVPIAPDGTYRVLAHQSFEAGATIEASDNGDNTGMEAKDVINGVHSASGTLALRPRVHASLGTESEALKDILWAMGFDKDTQASTTLTGAQTVSSATLTSSTNVEGGQLAKINNTTDGPVIRLVTQVSGAVASLTPPMTSAGTATDAFDTGINYSIADDGGQGRGLTIFEFLNTELWQEGLISATGTQVVLRIDPTQGLMLNADLIAAYHLYCGKTALNGSVAADATDTDIPLDSPSSISPLAYFKINDAEIVQAPATLPLQDHYDNLIVNDVVRAQAGTSVAAAVSTDPVEPTPPTATEQTLEPGFDWKNGFELNLWDPGSSKGGVFQVSTFELTITRPVTSKNNAGTHSNHDRYGVGQYTLSASFTGDLGVDDANTAFARFLGDALIQRKLQFLLVCGRTSTSAASVLAIGGGKFNIEAADTTTYQDEPLIEVAVTGTFRRPAAGARAISIACL